MIHLQDNLYLVQCYVRDRYNTLKLEKTFYTVFVYKEFKITLQTSFEAIDYTSYYYLPIINFGYCVDLERWDNKKLSYEYIHEHDEDNSLSTKKYIQDKNVRGII